MSKKGVTEFQQELKAGKIEFFHGECGSHACRIIEALHRDSPVPIGTVWYRFVGHKTLDILDCYVPAYARRCGVFTRMIDTIVRSYPKGVSRIMTTTVNRDSKAWFQKRGFVQDSCGDWTKTLNPKPSNPPPEYEI